MVAGSMAKEPPWWSGRHQVSGEITRRAYAGFPGFYAVPVQELLLAWFDDCARDLPWRRTRDPYAILVSEIMLQQTQVDRVVPRWLAWLERWPTVESLAAA